MTGLLQTGLDLFVRNASIPPWMQETATRFASTAAPVFLAFSHREISFERHPLQTLHHLVKRAAQGENISDLGTKLDAVPEVLRNDIYFEVWSQATDPDKGGDKWGERNALANFPRLLGAIKTVAEKRLDALPTEKRNAVYGTIYTIADQPQVDDFYWGEHQAKADTERLIRALHRHQALDLRGTRIPYYSDLEKEAVVPSKRFHLYRPELAQGQICLINGMGTSFSGALSSALRLSDTAGQGYNVHCTYSATVNPQWDALSGFIGQGGSATPPVLHLLEQWQDFFETDESNRLLQFCTSRGAIEVNTALHILPEHLRQRIIVIAVAPACLIKRQMAYKVVNLVILADPVVQIAANRELLDAEHTIKLNPHSDTVNPHDMHGASFREKIAPYVDSFIRTNDIGSLR
ncbi:MAG: hypothetical protein JSS60_06795 [Verrucomicrobia bacterium]|nr:hypothetical protein [Verrucomicrobiota bacterium]